MFKHARVVLGAHGAGLTNLVYCKPGTGLVLLPMNPHSDHTYSHMASALGFETWIVNEVSSNYYAHYGVISEEQIQLIVDTVERLLLGERTSPKARNLDEL